MNYISEELKDILKKELTQESAGTLKTVLDEYQQLKDEFPRLKDRIKELEDKLTKEQQERTALQNQVWSQTELDTKITAEESLRDANLLASKKHELECKFHAKEVAVYDKVLGQLLGNRRIREKIQDSVVIDGGEMNQGNYGPHGEPLYQKCGGIHERVEHENEREEA